MMNISNAVWLLHPAVVGICKFAINRAPRTAVPDHDPSSNPTGTGLMVTFVPSYNSCNLVGTGLAATCGPSCHSCSVPEGAFATAVCLRVHLPLFSPVDGRFPYGICPGFGYQSAMHGASPQ
eukprot:scpid90364/ scgid4414/ 